MRNAQRKTDTGREALYFASMIYTATTDGVTVSVRVQFVPRNDDAIRAHKWLWTYHITIANASSRAVQLKTRHWRITDALGRVQTVDGEGVVGETPRIAPGDSYSYASGCPLDTDSGTMGGHYMCVTDEGEWLAIQVPLFSLDATLSKRTLN
jgi:ApaG protein